jgi:hypothetical protein
MCCSTVVVSYQIKQNYAVQNTIEITTSFCVHIEVRKFLIGHAL